MHANFGIERERHNKLYLREYKNDSGLLHFHSQIELYFIDEGAMEVFVNNKQKLLKAGEMSVALSYSPHSYKTPEYSRSSVLIIPSYMCEEFISATNHKRVTNPFICDRETVTRIKEYFEKIKSEIKKEEQNEIKLIGYIYVILGIIMDSSYFEPAEEAIDAQLSTQLLFYINEHFAEDLTLSSLSAHLGYSASYISRYFKACFNTGFNEYLTAVRLKNALILMHEGKHSMTYCAMESGFSSMRTFYRVFFDEFGCSPKKYLSEAIRGNR